MHIKAVHEKIKIHQCPVCGKRFGLKPNLDIHIKGVHEKNKTHKCTNRSQLQNHLKEVHEENKPFAWPICNSKFGLKFRLAHEKKNRQTCSLCNSTHSFSEWRGKVKEKSEEKSVVELIIYI